MTTSPLVRRPWAAVPIYASVGVLGVLYIADIAEAESLTDASSGTFSLVWQWSLVIGSILCCGAILSPARWALHAKLAEAVGAFILSIEIAVYVGAMLHQLDERRPWATILMASGISLAALTRSVLAVRERGTILKTVAAIEAVRAEHI